MGESDDQPERQAPTKVSADLTEDADRVTAVSKRVRQTPKIKGTSARQDRADRKAMAELKERILRARARWLKR
jgi:hypothetical protein